MDRLSAQQRLTEVADHARLPSLRRLPRIHAMVIEPCNDGHLDACARRELTRLAQTGDAPVCF